MSNTITEKNNYEQMAESARALFLNHDKNSIAGKYGTAFDDEFLYIDFLHRSFRIARDTGHVFMSANKQWIPAGPSETMIFYDIFCYGEPDAAAAGDFLNHGSLVGKISATANPGKDMYLTHTKRFDGHTGLLKKACEYLRGVPLPKGDVDFEIPLFSFMDCRFQFWESDEDFPARIVVYVDKNILHFMHFETTWYVSECLLERIENAAGL